LVSNEKAMLQTKKEFSFQKDFNINDKSDISFLSYIDDEFKNVNYQDLYDKFGDKLILSGLYEGQQQESVGSVLIGRTKYSSANNIIPNYVFLSELETNSDNNTIYQDEIKDLDLKKIINSVEIDENNSVANIRIGNDEERNYLFECEDLEVNLKYETYDVFGSKTSFNLPIKEKGEVLKEKEIQIPIMKN
jgi:hypothetical protein